jgi:hypothetical protein
LDLKLPELKKGKPDREAIKRLARRSRTLIERASEQA